MKLKSLYTQENTYNNYIKPYFEKRIVDKITKQDIMTWQRKLTEATFTKTKKTKSLLSNAYLAKIQEYLKTILIFGEKYDYISKNPFTIKIMQRKEEAKKEMLYWTTEEFNRFINEIDDIVYEALFRVLYGCGLREGEALALTIGDVNRKDGTITVNKTYDSIHRINTTPKTKNSYRTVQMTDKVKTAVERLIDYYSGVEGFDDDVILFGYMVHLPPKSSRIDK
ncbi:MAG: Site-specific recombinase XerD [Erysipelotrichaceae bacterium]|nr:MAG: Site-specific recombinase [Erysipelotrichaceae bacterium]TXT17243.1 MAG: Site-specific recombinase XerD [Erysipelotrichaceae bacterium]